MASTRTTQMVVGIARAGVPVHRGVNVSHSRPMNLRQAFRQSTRHVTTSPALRSNTSVEAGKEVSKATSRVQTYFGPTSWLRTTALRPLTRTFEAYDRVLQRRPYASQVASCIVIYLLGDLSSQYFFRSQEDVVEDDGKESSRKRTFWRDDYDPSRSVRVMIIGSTVAIPSYLWFRFLGTHFNVPGSKVLTLLYKIIVNQVVFNPVFNSYFFGMHALLTFKGGWPTWEELDAQKKIMAIKARIVETVPTAFINSFKFWPPITAFTYVYIPAHFRNVFQGCMAVIWQTYLGMVNLRAANKEKQERQLLLAAQGSEISAPSDALSAPATT